MAPTKVSENCPLRVPTSGSAAIATTRQCKSALVDIMVRLLGVHCTPDRYSRPFFCRLTPDPERLELRSIMSRCPHHNESRMTVRVECYAGRKADERPIRFYLDGHAYLVEEVVDQWCGPADTFFKVHASDGNLYILRHGGNEDAWSLESFRRA